MSDPSLFSAGWRMPAEWEPHQATWLSWPARRDTSFPGEGVHDRVLPVFLEIIGALAPHETVYLNCTDPDDRRYVQEGLSAEVLAGVVITDIPAVYPWCRDHGAIFVVHDADRRIAATSWKYNAWGGKYPEAFPDDAISSAMARRLGVPEFDGGMVLEGGSIDSNGCGTVLTTESCLLNPNRNPGMTRQDIENRLRDFFGFEKVLWLGDGIAGDDTDGHVDDITRFVDPETVVTVIEDDPADPNYGPLMENYERLCGMKTEDGSLLNVLTLPMPAPVVFHGERLPASYANFYIANDVVLVPVFNDPNDEIAVTRLGECFPARRIVPINSRELIIGLGSFHCLTQQVPAVRRPAPQA